MKLPKISSLPLCNEALGFRKKKNSYIQAMTLIKIPSFHYIWAVGHKKLRNSPFCVGRGTWGNTQLVVHLGSTVHLRSSTLERYDLT